MLVPIPSYSLLAANYVHTNDKNNPARDVLFVTLYEPQGVQGCLIAYAIILTPIVIGELMSGFIIGNREGIKR
jgi:hypothetical protein